MIKIEKPSDLDQLYSDADQIDKEIFAEMRSNIMLISGDHYNKRGDDAFQAARSSRDIASQVNKLRLVKNHIHRIHRRYCASILSYANGVNIVPQLEHELQDQKAAELAKAVWDDMYKHYKLKGKRRRWVSDLVGIGEVWVKVFWDDTKGTILGYEPETDEDGNIQVDENGDPLQGQKPIFSGEIQFERLFGFNVLRDPDAKELDECKYFIVRKMVDASFLKQKYGSDPEIKRHLDNSSNEEYIIFNTSKNSYEKQKGKTSIREFYFKPCIEYPNGYYYIAVKGAILEEGELPFGIFPLVYQTCDEIQTSPRGRSVIKQAKPYQAEINRAASNQAMHQITIGDDKVLYQMGTKLSPGALLPGVRGIAYQGTPPTILPGRDGNQYAGHITANIAEMNELLDVDTIFNEKAGGQNSQDIYALLFRSAAHKQQLSAYSEKFEEFESAVCEVALDTAKNYYNEAMLVPSIGKREYFNISEFQNVEKLRYRISVVEQDNTIDTQFGKMMSFQHLLQYSGNALEKQDIGLLMRSMPYANKEEQFKEYTIDYDNAKNLLLALDRGEYPQSIPEDNHEYMIKKLSHRMKQADFKILPPEIQQAYSEKLMEHQQMAEELRQKIIAEQSEYIPTEGAMIACDSYVQDPNDPTKAPKRARVPQKALEWLMEKIQAQQSTVQMVEGMNLGEMQAMEAVAPQPQLGEVPGQGMPPMNPNDPMAAALQSMGQ